jgi:hypothetical protein
MREEDVFHVTHSIEIACNDNKLSPKPRLVSEEHFLPVLPGPVVAGDVW